MGWGKAVSDAGGVGRVWGRRGGRCRSLRSRPVVPISERVQQRQLPPANTEGGNTHLIVLVYPPGEAFLEHSVHPKRPTLSHSPQRKRILTHNPLLLPLFPSLSRFSSAKMRCHFPLPRWRILSLSQSFRELLARQAQADRVELRLLPRRRSRSVSAPLLLASSFSEGGGEGGVRVARPTLSG